MQYPPTLRGNQAAKRASVTVPPPFAHTERRGLALAEALGRGVGCGAAFLQPSTPITAQSPTATESRRDSARRPLPRNRFIRPQSLPNTALTLPKYVQHFQ